MLISAQAREAMAVMQKETIIIKTNVLERIHILLFVTL